MIQNPTLGYIYRGNKNHYLKKGSVLPCSLGALFIINKTWKQVSINRKMDKENVIHPHTLEYFQP